MIKVVMTFPGKKKDQKTYFQHIPIQKTCFQQTPTEGDDVSLDALVINITCKAKHSIAVQFLLDQGKVK